MFTEIWSNASAPHEWTFRNFRYSAISAAMCSWQQAALKKKKYLLLNKFQLVLNLQDYCLKITFHWTIRNYSICTFDEKLETKFVKSVKRKKNLVYRSGQVTNYRTSEKFPSLAWFLAIVSNHVCLNSGVLA